MGRSGKHFRHLFDWGSQNYIKRSDFGVATKTYRRIFSIDRSSQALILRSITPQSNAVSYVYLSHSRVTSQSAGLRTRCTSRYRDVTYDMILCHCTGVPNMFWQFIFNQLLIWQIELTTLTYLFLFCWNKITEKLKLNCLYIYNLQ